MLLKWRRASTVGLMLLLVILTGCAKGTAHVTVHMDGSVDLAALLRLESRTHALFNNTMEDSLISRLQAAGIQLKKTQDGNSTEYQYLRTYSSREIKSLMAQSSSDVVDSDVKTTTTWFFTKYDLQVQLHLSQYSDQILRSIEKSDIPNPLIRLLMKSFTVDFKLTLPFNMYGANNAAEQNGRTLTWPINLVDPEPIRMVIYVPDVRSIAITAGVGGLTVVLTVIYCVRRRRRTN